MARKSTAAFAFVLLLRASNARAVDVREEAKAHHDLGRIEFQKANYAVALAEFRKSYDLAPLPDLLFNIALCLEHLGDREGAAAQYERYLAVRPKLVERSELERHIAELRGPKQTKVPVVVPFQIATDTPLQPAPKRPIWRRPWFWGVAGGGALAVTATIVAIAVAASFENGPLTFPPVTAQ